MFEFMVFNAWDEKIKEGWRNGGNYVTGEEYNKFLAGMISTSQYVEDGYTWLTESELGTALMTLGFTYAAYRLTTKSGTATVSNEKVSGAGKLEIPQGLSQKQFGEMSAG